MSAQKILVGLIQTTVIDGHEVGIGISLYPRDGWDVKPRSSMPMSLCIMPSRVDVAHSVSIPPEWYGAGMDCNFLHGV